MSRTRPVNLKILDKDYIIACPTDECDDLVSSARYLTKKMQEIRESGKVVSTERIAVMAALNIVHELLHHHENELIEPALQRLEDKITTALAELK